MFIVGELINASRKAVRQAIEEQDAGTIQDLAKSQAEAGADFIDVNAGVFVGREAEYLPWLVKTVQEVVGTPCCIDSPDPDAIAAALAVHKGRAMVNSISLELDRYDRMLPILTGSDCRVVALCMGDRGMPETAGDRFAIARDLVGQLMEQGVEADRIHVDPLVQPVSTGSRYGWEMIHSVSMIMENLPGVHTICGLSNVSYGLPERKLLNQEFVVLAMAWGLDGAIVNPTDARLMANIRAAEALLGRDEDCMEWLKAYRAGKLAL
ncbi:MAG: methyltetrahydrofolate cobalamin methyltransferase [Proteobacteria bacterium]|nr:methyltetrahydrofolate cobalamin methyltransferase [Pseudomonadota bacterium]